MENAVYEIRVRAYLNPIRGESFAGWRMEYDATRLETILTGEVPDQAALYGLLLQTRNLALTLVSVRRIEGFKEQDEKSNTK